MGHPPLYEWIVSQSEWIVLAAQPAMNFARPAAASDRSNALSDAIRGLLGWQLTCFLPLRSAPRELPFKVAQLFTTAGVRLAETSRYRTSKRLMRAFFLNNSILK